MTLPRTISPWIKPQGWEVLNLFIRGLECPKRRPLRPKHANVHPNTAQVRAGQHYDLLDAQQ